MAIPFFDTMALVPFPSPEPGEQLTCRLVGGTPSRANNKTSFS